MTLNFEQAQAKVEKWIFCPKPNPEAAIRLISFPYSGSGPSVFRQWPDTLPDEVEMWGIRWPGRENRLREPAYTDITTLVVETARVLRPLLDKPFVIFGHSLGALAGFELTRYWRQHDGPQPKHLLLSGHRAPHRPPRNSPIHQADNQTFLQRIRNLGGTPERFFEIRELVELMLPSLRADFKIWETYVHQQGAPLEIPITALGGYNDTEATEEDIAAWRQHTQDLFDYHMFPGGHFYFRQDAAPLLEILQTTLCGYL